MRLLSMYQSSLEVSSHVRELCAVGYGRLQVSLVSSVAILLEPTSSQADELRNLLNVVTGRAPDQDGRSAKLHFSNDPFSGSLIVFGCYLSNRVSIATVRELAIVELFSQKEKEFDSRPPSPKPSAPSNDYLHMMPGGSTSPYPRPQQLPPSPSITFRGAVPQASLWGRPDFVDELCKFFDDEKTERCGCSFLLFIVCFYFQTVISYHKSKGDPMPINRSDLNSPRPRPTASDSAWSARAVGASGFTMPSKPIRQATDSPNTICRYGRSYGSSAVL